MLVTCPPAVCGAVLHQHEGDAHHARQCEECHQRGYGESMLEFAELWVDRRNNRLFADLPHLCSSGFRAGSSGWLRAGSSGWLIAGHDAERGPEAVCGSYNRKSDA
jgi:hypothetical protein